MRRCVLWGALCVSSLVFFVPHFPREISLRVVALPLPRPLPPPPSPAMAAPPRRGPLLLRSYDVVRRAGEGDAGQLGE